MAIESSMAASPRRDNTRESATEVGQAPAASSGSSGSWIRASRLAASAAMAMEMPAAWTRLGAAVTVARSGHQRPMHRLPMRSSLRHSGGTVLSGRTRATTAVDGAAAR